MIHVVCIKWGTKYSSQYVNNLYHSLISNSTRSIKFWCFTDDPAGIDSSVACRDLPFAQSLQTWWNKLWLFSEQLPIPVGEKIFYIDLDTLIVDNIDSLLDHNADEIIVLEDFFRGKFKTATNIGSGLMCWQHGTYTTIWNKFIQDPNSVVKAAKTRGDQWWIEKNLPSWQHWQDIEPGSVVSFKVHCREGLPSTAKIVCYHGRPSIPESATVATTVNGWTIYPQVWVKQFWNYE